MSKDRWIAEGVHETRGLQTAIYNVDKYQNVSISPVFQQWVIVDVIFDPIIVDEKKYEQLKKKYEDFPISNLDLFAKNKILPRNSVIARKVIRLAEGNKYDADKSKILLPFFPPALSLPCKPGEHVWVMFEYLNSISDIGYWICSVVGSGATDDVNHSHYPRVLDGAFIEGNAGDKWKETTESETPSSKQKPKYRFEESTFFLQDKKIYERALTDSEASFASVYESVPRFKKRPGDIAFEGSNNTLIVLGRDRTGKAVEYTTIDTTDPNNPIQNGAKSIKKDARAFYKKRNAGSIDIVAGRGQQEATSGKTVINTLLNPELDKSLGSLIADEGDPDFKNDRSRIYVSQNTEIDKSLELENYNSKFNIKDSEAGDSGIVIKTDKIRIFARSDVQILVTGFDEETKTTEITQEIPEDLNFLKDEVKEKIVNKVKNQKLSDTNWASITIKSNGDIIFKPSNTGYIKLGDETADRAILCTDIPVDAAAMGGDIKIHDPGRGKENPGGAVPIFTTGNKQVGTGEAGQGTFSRKVLIK